MPRVLGKAQHQYRKPVFEDTPYLKTYRLNNLKITLCYLRPIDAWEVYCETDGIKINNLKGPEGCFLNERSAFEAAQAYAYR